MSTRTNIVLDDELVAQAMAKARVKTKKGAVEAALRAYVRKPDYSGLLAARGKGLIDEDYDPRGLYGLTESALKRRGLKSPESLAVALVARPAKRSPGSPDSAERLSKRAQPAPRKMTTRSKQAERGAA
jgi:Bacterial antitoxin of type II TA system, VapB